MIKVLGLALYGPLAASTRYRMGQYAPGLRDHGIELSIRHLLDDGYLRRRFAGATPDLLPMLRSGARRLSDLAGQRGYDALMLYSELFPLLPGWLETALLRRPYVYDFDDAFYLKYRDGRMGFLGPVLGGKFERVMRGAAAITAGNRVLAAHARASNPATTLLPTAVDTDRYVPGAHAPTRELTIGWIGSPSTAPYLSLLAGPLEALGREGPVRLVVVGGAAPEVPGIAVESVAWSEATEVAQINRFDIGVMPLTDDPWARGKCAFKLIQYMACGVPVVASPVGANVDVVGVDCGLLAADADAWVTALRALRDDGQLRRTLGERGRARIEQDYSLRRNLPILADVLRGVAEGSR
jgi:glycosyltransferase involved in cell wall biosynthesis